MKRSRRSGKQRRIHMRKRTSIDRKPASISFVSAPTHPHPLIDIPNSMSFRTRVVQSYFATIALYTNCVTFNRDTVDSVMSFTDYANGIFR